MALIQAAGTASNAGADPVVNISGSSPGSTIIVIASNADNGENFTTPTDNKSNIYVATDILNGTGAAGRSTSIWYCYNATSGVTSVTINGGVSTTAWVIEESGLASSPYDQHAIQQQGITPWSSGNTGTLAQANEVCYGASANAGPSSDMSFNGAWNTSGLGGVDNTLYGGGIIVARQVVSSTSALAATGTQIGGGSLECSIVTFKQAAAPAGHPGSLILLGVGM